MKKIHLIMPMGGRGSRFTDDKFQLPKPLIIINDKPFFYWSTISIIKYVEIASLTFVVLKEHVEKFRIDEEIIKYFPTAIIVTIPDVLPGAVLTCLEGIKHIDDDNPIVFNDCDHMFKCTDFYNYCYKDDFDVDGALLTFLSNEPKFSYLILNENNEVAGTIEKIVMSDKAICGAYYFKNKKIFEESVAEYLLECNYSEYFVSGVYNIMTKKNMKISNFQVDWHLAFGTPDEYNSAINSEYFGEIE